MLTIDVASELRQKLATLTRCRLAFRSHLADGAA